MKTEELIGAQLDYWVAKALGVEASVDSQMQFCPSTHWEHGGPIIERERIAICRGDGDEWFAGWQASSDAMDLPGFRRVAGECWHSGPTPLIAAMRAYVASKFGDEFVDKP